MTAAVSARADASGVTVYRADRLDVEAFADLRKGLSAYEIWSRLAFHEIRQRFRRSLLGPFWITISMGVMVGALGLVFGTLFGQDIGHTLPYIATGLIFWGLLTSCITEGTGVFTGSDGYIRNVPLPVSVHFFRMMARNLIVWGFNMAIYVGVVLVFGVPLTWHILLFIPGFIVFVLCAACLSLSAGILSTRYRDIPQVIFSFLQVVFFVTPVFWSPETLPSRPHFVQWNPLFHLIEIVRAPLLGQAPSIGSWSFALAAAALGIVVTAYLYRRAYPRIAYWV